jgi:hypothetical protein
MMDANSVGRLTCLSPIAWQDGWPYFGLPGNLRRTPRTWVKPRTGRTSPPAAPYERNDDFSGPRLANGWTLAQFDQFTGQTATAPLSTKRVWLRAHCDFLRESAFFSYSMDGTTFVRLGADFPLIFQLKTFQGVRYALFHFNLRGAPGGFADFDSFSVEEPHPRGLFRPIPYGRTVTFKVHGREVALAAKGGNLVAVAPVAATPFTVVDRGLGRVALRSSAGFFFGGGYCAAPSDESGLGSSQRRIHLSVDRKRLWRLDPALARDESVSPR